MPASLEQGGGHLEAAAGDIGLVLGGSLEAEAEQSACVDGFPVCPHSGACRDSPGGALSTGDRKCVIQDGMNMTLCTPSPQGHSSGSSLSLHSL